MFKVNGTFRKYYGTVTLVSADNPASSALGGFKESTSAYRPCRQCLGTNDEIKHQVILSLTIHKSCTYSVTFRQKHSNVHIITLFFRWRRSALSYAPLMSMYTNVTLLRMVLVMQATSQRNLGLTAAVYCFN